MYDKCMLPAIVYYTRDSFMPRLVLALLSAVLLLAAPASAQDIISFKVEPEVNKTTTQLSQRLTAPTQLHITDVLLGSEDGRAALSQFQSQKAALSVARKSSGSAQALGTQQIFKVFNLNTNGRDDIDFTLKETSGTFNIWVETAELDNGHVRDEDIAELKAALATETPTGSYNSGAGIIVNDEAVFGAPPNIDGDDKTDVLLVDVRDDFDPDNGKFLYVGGFFDPSDLTATGNNMDILYLDTMPTLVSSDGSRNPVSSMLSTAAHEYQHLIHANYDGNESAFVNEAQSEWAELMNGFEGRSMAFLSSLSEHNTSFYTFRSDVLTDRERGQLFTLYLAEQLGVLTAGSVTQQTANDQAGYQQVIGSLDTFFDHVVDFFTANLINDTSVDARFGYSNPFVVGKRTIVDETTDARSVEELAAKSTSMNPGTVRYSKLTNVTDPTVYVDASSIQGVAAARSKLAVRIVKKVGNDYSFEDHVASADPIAITGTFDEVIIMIVHREASTSSTVVNATYSATWSSGEVNTFTELQSFDSGTPTGDFFAFTNLNGHVIQSTRFILPDYNGDVILDEVRVAPFYFSQFSGSGLPQSSPRDFKLLVLGESGGLPDTDLEYFSLDVTDTRSFAAASTAPFTFLSINLASYSAELNNLPDTFHVALAELGADVNYMVLAPSAYTTENLSFIGDDRDNSWGALWDQTLNDGTSMEEKVFPIRASFLVNEIVGVEDELANEFSFVLDQNYPNPFSAFTTVRFSTPAAADVQLEVFDLLGRKVTDVVDAVYPAGVHTATVDATNWASGLYLYRLRSGDVSLTRTLSVVK